MRLSVAHVGLDTKSVPLSQQSDICGVSATCVTRFNYLAEVLFENTQKIFKHVHVFMPFGPDIR